VASHSLLPSLTRKLFFLTPTTLAGIRPSIGKRVPAAPENGKSTPSVKGDECYRFYMYFFRCSLLSPTYIYLKILPVLPAHETAQDRPRTPWALLIILIF
jgi:hypothetical protein